MLVFWVDFPKGPSRTKFGTESKFGTEREICYSASKTLRNVLADACFPKETVQIVKHYGRRGTVQIEGP